MDFYIPPDLVRGPTTEPGEMLAMAGEANWGMNKFGVDRLRAITKGKGQITGAIDTGIDKDHPMLASNFLAAKDFTGSRYGFADRNGHGTHVSGTIFGNNPLMGVAPEAKGVHGKGLGDSGSGGGSGIAAAMLWCVAQGAEVLSMSLGSSGQDTTITNTMKELAQKGIWIIAAAGNSGQNTPDVDWPGRSPYCISVAALNSDLSVASFSNSGAKIDTSGAGVGIWSARPGGGLQQMSGTSMATPFIAGILTLIRGALKLSGKAIPEIFGLRELIFRKSTDIGPVGDDRRSGPGWLTPALLELGLVKTPPIIGQE